MRPRHLAFVLALFSACADSGVDQEQDDLAVEGKADSAGARARDVLSTALSIDVGARSGVATVSLAPSSLTSASFEVAGLHVKDVHGPAGHLRYRVVNGRLNVSVPASRRPVEVTVDYTLSTQQHFDGWLSGGSTVTWPYFCGNLFPCHSAPSDGQRFTLELTGIPDGQQAIYPREISADAPPYMVAWAVGHYEYLELGRTHAGTKIGVYHFPGKLAEAKRGTADLVAAFEWYESTLGAYRFGAEVASVAADWGSGDYGGMEHHPYWHVDKHAMGDPVTHAHEAAHGWFGNGIRLRCWEDFVLSEGTVSYLTARALGAAGGAAAEAKVWSGYQEELDAALQEDHIAWPQSCGKVDILKDKLFSSIPYMKGAFFYRAVEAKVGKAALDRALGRFYREHAGEAAGMQDMLDTILAETGFDPAQLAQGWLRSLGTPRP